MSPLCGTSLSLIIVTALLRISYDHLMEGGEKKQYVSQMGWRNMPTRTKIGPQMRNLQSYSAVVPDNNGERQYSSGQSFKKYT